MKNYFSFVASLLFLFSSCTSSSLAKTESGLAGNWTGESICTVRPSPCHDEKVIYHITEPDSNGRLQIGADKIVNGKPDNMGTLDCTYDNNASHINCQMKNGYWDFDVVGKKMTGTLKLPDGTLFRRVSVTKED